MQPTAPAEPAAGSFELPPSQDESVQGLFAYRHKDSATATTLGHAPSQVETCSGPHRAPASRLVLIRPWQPTKTLRTHLSNRSGHSPAPPVLQALPTTEPTPPPPQVSRSARALPSPLPQAVRILARTQPHAPMPRLPRQTTPPSRGAALRVAGTLRPRPWARAKGCQPAPLALERHSRQATRTRCAVTYT